jgi:proteasome lid subunit RPN8/RPN11
MPEMVRDALTAMARSSPDREICGFILGDWSICPITNVAENDRDFKMSDADVISFFTMNYGSVLGIYHSHPSGREDPSEADIEYAPARLRYWIVTASDVIEWGFGDGEIGRIA